MKKLCALTAFVLTIATFSPVHAQSGMSLQNWKDLLLGPMFTAGASVNAGPVADGWKTGAKFAYTGGVMLTFPWSPQIALDATVGFESRGVNFHPQNVDTGGFDFTFGYLVIRPEFRLSGFVIGLGLGLPMSANTQVSGVPLSGGPTTSDMAFLVEGRIGGDIPIVTGDNGQLHLLIGAAYPFTNLLSSKSFSDDKTKNNGPIASLQMGLTYLFDLSPH